MIIRNVHNYRLCMSFKKSKQYGLKQFVAHTVNLLLVVYVIQKK